jgi:hypothetical protein
VAGNFTRTTESFQTPRVAVAVPTDPTLDIILGRITLNANPPDGAVTAVDFSERTEAGAKIGQTDLPALRFTVPAHGGSEWPRIAGNNVSGPGTGMQGIDVDASIVAFSGSVDVAQNVTVQGDLNVRGVVNKVNDLEVKDSIIRVNKYEPPSATPVVVNGGLEVYRGGTASNAQIIWDETLDVWRAGVESSLDTIVKSSHTHDGTTGNGGTISHTSLSNIAPAVVTSTDATLNKHVSNLQTKKWEDHVNNAVVNPHATTAAQVGALAAADYGFARSVYAGLVFTQSSGNGAIQTITTNFRTQFVWVSGTIAATLGGRVLGSVTSGYADMRSTTAPIQRGTGVLLERSNVVPYVVSVPGTYVGLCGATFSDLTALPTRFVETLGVVISSVTATSVTIQLQRSVPFSTTITYLPVAGFNIQLMILCFG